jgi:hypothetical protein
MKSKTITALALITKRRLCSGQIPDSPSRWDLAWHQSRASCENCEWDRPLALPGPGAGLAASAPSPALQQPAPWEPWPTQHFQAAGCSAARWDVWPLCSLGTNRAQRMWGWGGSGETCSAAQGMTRASGGQFLQQPIPLRSGCPSAHTELMS